MSPKAGIGRCPHCGHLLDGEVRYSKQHTTLNGCSCPDWFYRGMRSGRPCKHMKLLMLNLEAKREEAAATDSEAF